MKLSPIDQEKFFQKPHNQYRVILVYGQDDGAINEYKRILSNFFVPDKDPFSLVEIHNDKIVSEPELFYDEVCAISFSGGKRLIIINNVGDAIAKLVKDFLTNPVGDGYVLMIGENLMPAKSALVQAVEKSPMALAVRLFADNERKISQILDEELHKFGIKIDSDARGYLLAQLGGDRAITRNEIEKCCLYALDSKRLIYKDVVALMGGREAQIDSLMEAVLTGDIANTEQALFYLHQARTEPIILMRSMVNQLKKCEKLRELLDNGVDFASACKSLQIFWKSEAMMRKATQRFNRIQLKQYQWQFLLCEKYSKESATPVQIMLEREFYRLARI